MRESSIFDLGGGILDKKMVFRYKLILCVVLAIVLGIAVGWYIKYVRNAIPERITLNENSNGTIDFNLPFVGTASLHDKDGEILETALNLTSPLTINSGETAEFNIEVKLFGLFDIKNVKVEVKEEEAVVAGGIPVGIYIETDGVLVVDLGEVVDSNGEITSPSKGSLMAGDYIIAVDDYGVDSKETLIALVANYNGDYLKIDVRRNGAIETVKIKPTLDKSGVYKLGVWVRDDCQGLGTLTYIDKEGAFGTLGHAISDGDTGKIVEIAEGSLYTARIWSIIKGAEGAPGEIIGSINYGETSYLGEISDNETIGIYGTVDEQIYAYVDEVYVDVAYKQDVQKGSAVIRTFVGNEIQDYEIKITELSYSDSGMNKGIEFIVTDKELLGLTNGIVQGMSGSPILQNGRIVGAVTHVLVNDPTRGYGIFIENMLEH